MGRSGRVTKGRGKTGLLPDGTKPEDNPFTPFGGRGYKNGDFQILKERKETSGKGKNMKTSPHNE